MKLYGHEFTQNMSEVKECFVICPIGSEGSDTRERADKLMEHIIEDAVGEFGYTPVRSDKMPDPGSITSQIIQKLVESDLVIADLTEHNPNVFYELAVRHATAKPYIQLIDSSESIPFDISDTRTIYYDFDISNAREASDRIQAHLETIEEQDPEFDNPISRSADLKYWRESGDPMQQNLADIMDGLNQLNMRLNRIEQKITGDDLASRLSRIVLENLFPKPPVSISELDEEQQQKLLTAYLMTRTNFEEEDSESDEN